MKETAAQKSVRQFLFVVARDYHDGPLPRLDHLPRFVDMEFHPVEFEQQIVGEFDIGLVDFVDQQYALPLGFEGLPDLALDDVITDVMDFFVAELRIAQS